MSHSPSPDSDENRFTQEMLALGVKPLTCKPQTAPQPSKKQLPKKQAANKESFRQRQAMAEGPKKRVMGDGVQEWLNPHDIVEFRQAGIQLSTFKDFKQGKIRPTLTLDLHRCTVEQSRQLLIYFLAECLASEVRCALVMHGKGFHTAFKNPDAHPDPYNHKAVATLKSYSVHWLKQLPEVMGLSSAQAKDGGTGALYVLLRKQNN